MSYTRAPSRVQLPIQVWDVSGESGEGLGSSLSEGSCRGGTGRVVA